MHDKRSFCHKCAFQLSSTRFRFCPNCGTKLREEDEYTKTALDSTSSLGPESSTANAKSSTAPTSKKRINSSSCNTAPDAPLYSFQQFKIMKESERRSSFSIRGENNKKKKEEKPVVIHVGIMAESLTIRQGQNLPIRVLPSATAADILSLAIKKHSAFNIHFNSKCRYKLVYKDGAEVVNVPGTDRPFTVERYKEESGYSYSRIVLFLLTAPRLKCSDVWNELIKERDCITDDNEASSDSECDLPALPILEIEPLFPLPGSSGDPYSTANDKLIECPTCFQKFPAAHVSAHADECAESYWSRTDCSTPTSTVPILIEDNATVSGASMPSLKNEIVRLQEIAVKQPPVSVTVCRKSIWNDFKQARDRYYRPDLALKLTFSGEPAVDIGGPRREFFAGTL
eukprot:gene1039-366_t